MRLAACVEVPLHHSPHPIAVALRQRGRLLAWVANDLRERERGRESGERESGERVRERRESEREERE